MLLLFLRFFDKFTGKFQLNFNTKVQKLQNISIEKKIVFSKKDFLV